MNNPETRIDLMPKFQDYGFCPTSGVRCLKLMQWHADTLARDDYVTYSDRVIALEETEDRVIGIANRSLCFEPTAAGGTPVVLSCAAKVAVLDVEHEYHESGYPL